MFRLRVVLSLCLTSATTSQLLAQALPSQATPEASARGNLEAIRQGDFLTAARMVHPVRLRATRLMFDSLLRNGQATYIAQRIFQLPDSQALLALDDARFTAGLFRFNFLLGGGDRYMAMYRGVEIAGTARQGRDTAHVVYRYTLPPDSLQLESYNVATQVRCPAGWCAGLLGGFHGLLRSLVAPMRQVQPPPP